MTVAAVLALAIAFLLGRASVSVSPDTAADPAGQSPTASADSDGAAANNSAKAGAQPEFAPSQTDPNTVKMLREQPRRQADDPRALGDINAPVTMVAYEDFSCPMCTRYFTQVHPQLKQLVDSGELRIEFHDMVIFPNYGSDIAAKASRAAADQNLFWEFTEAAFAQAGDGNHPTYTEESVLELAKQIGVGDMDRFKSVLSSDDTAASVSNETRDAHQKVGITGTPFFIINDAVVPGALPADFMVKTVDNQLREAKQR